MSDSDESVYQSDEEIKCILQSSSSSSDENEERGRVPRLERGTAYTDENHLKISECLKSIYSEDGGTLYQSPSLMKTWGVPGRIPDDLICDVCILSPTKPVTVLSFIRGPLEDDDERIVKYNTRVARHLVTSVRAKLFTNFSVVSGIFDLHSRREETFQSEIKRLESEANLFSVSRSLDMTSTKYKSLVHFIQSMSAVFPGFVQKFPIGDSKETRHENNKITRAVEEPHDPTEMQGIMDNLVDPLSQVMEGVSAGSQLSQQVKHKTFIVSRQRVKEKKITKKHKHVIHGLSRGKSRQKVLCKERQKKEKKLTNRGRIITRSLSGMYKYNVTSSTFLVQDNMRY